MKFVIPAGVLLLCATTLQAQEPARAAAPAELAPIVAPAPAKWTTTPALQVAPAPTSSDATAATATSKVNATKEATVKSETVVQSTPRNFWWLVGAIVLGGVILAVLL